MSSAMTEVAVRLAEPDRGAEQSAASLGQAVRRQVSFMNEAISRALGRAGELEALVHNEVAALEKSYGENEHKIKGLIQELVGERHALVSTTDKVAETSKSMGSEVPNLIEKLSQQQIKLAKIIEGAGQNLIALENQLPPPAAASRPRSPTARSSCRRCSTTTRWRSTPRWPAAPRPSTSSWSSARARSMPPSPSACRCSTIRMLRSTIAIDSAVNEKARALTVAMENHVHVALRHAGPAGRQSRRIHDARHRRRAPHQRQHHAPVAARRSRACPARPTC